MKGLVKAMYKQGDIVKVPFLFSDDRGSKPRPAVIISNINVNNTNDVIMAQITAKPRKDNFSFHLNPEGLEINLIIIYFEICLHS